MTNHRISPPTTLLLRWLGWRAPLVPPQQLRDEGLALAAALESQAAAAAPRRRSGIADPSNCRDRGECGTRHSIPRITISSQRCWPPGVATATRAGADISQMHGLPGCWCRPASQLGTVGPVGQPGWSDIISHRSKLRLRSQTPCMPRSLPALE